jgi:hypothetical protein
MSFHWNSWGKELRHSMRQVSRWGLVNFWYAFSENFIYYRFYFNFIIFTMLPFLRSFCVVIFKLSFLLSFLYFSLFGFDFSINIVIIYRYYFCYYPPAPFLPYLKTEHTGEIVLLHLVPFCEDEVCLVLFDPTFL